MPCGREAGASAKQLCPMLVHVRRWQDLNQAYVKLPCVLDTPSKRRRKEVRLHGCTSRAAAMGGSAWAAIYT